jgi:integrase
VTWQAKIHTAASPRLYDNLDHPVIAVKRTYDAAIKDFKDATKGGNARIVPASDQLLEVLKPLAAIKQPNDFLFFDSRGEAIRIWGGLNRKWERAQRACGIEPRKFHALRHTYATLFLSHGGSPFALQRILGHSSAKITDKYSHFSQQLIESSRNVVTLGYPQKPRKAP